MASSTDWDELLWAWQGWMNFSGRPVVNMYEDLVKVLNRDAEDNGKTKLYDGRSENRFDRFIRSVVSHINIY